MKWDAFVSGGAYTLRALPAAAQTCENWYCEQDEAGSGRGGARLTRTPGLALVTTLPQQPLRGLWPGSNRLFAVSGARLYEVFADGTYTDRGNVGNDNLPAQIFPNGGQLLVISAGNAYVDTGSGPVQCRFSLQYNDLIIDATNLNQITSQNTPFDATDIGRSLQITGGTGFTAGTLTITAVDGTGKATLSGNAGTILGSVAGTAIEWLDNVTASQGGLMDTYFFAVKPSDNKVFYSAPGDGTNWNEADFFSKDAYPDHIAAFLADHQELWLMGDEQSVEVWQDVATDPNNPFQRDPGATMHYGCFAAWSPARLDKGVAFIGFDQQRGGPVAFYAQGFQPVRISTHAIEQEWKKYPSIADAVSFSMFDEGHHFWIVSFPSGNATWVYDATTKIWHRRGWWNGASLDRHRAYVHAYVALSSDIGFQHYVGDWQNGKIYILSMAYFDDAGTPIRRQRAAPYLANDGNRARTFALQIDMETGLGAVHPALDWSDDNGHTWHAPRTLALAAAGYTQRALFPQLGQFRFRIFRYTVSDAVPCDLVGAYLRGAADKS